MNWELVLLAQTVALVTLSLLVVYPVYAFSQNVLHTWGIVLLSTTLLVFTASSVIDQFTPYVALAEAVHAVSDLTLLGALYLFAREFIRTDGTDSIEYGTTETDAAETPSKSRTGGGFEDADDG